MKEIRQHIHPKTSKKIPMKKQIKNRIKLMYGKTNIVIYRYRIEKNSDLNKVEMEEHTRSYGKKSIGQKIKNITVLRSGDQYKT